MKVCAAPGCPRLTTGTRCELHAQQRRRAYDQARGNSNQRGYGARWRKLRDAFLAANPICSTPGCGELATDADHIVPRAQGGTDDWENLQALCHSHHAAKTAKTDGGFGNRH